MQVDMFYAACINSMILKFHLKSQRENRRKIHILWSYLCKIQKHEKGQGCG